MSRKEIETMKKLITDKTDQEQKLGRKAKTYNFVVC